MLASDPVFKKVYEALERRDERATIVSTKSLNALSSICAVAAVNATHAIYIDGFEYQRAIGVTNCIPKYSYCLVQSQQYLKDCKKKRTEIIARCKASNTYDTILAIHDELVRNTQYQDGGKLSHSIVGPLLFGRGVCDGFSKTLKFILDELSIPCFVVSGTATDPQTGSNESHAWNIVKIDNSWVHIDLTFDATISQSSIIRHDYFALTAQMVSRDHQFNVAFYPLSSNVSMEYYHRQKLIVSNKKNLYALLMERFSSNENVITFRLETPNCRVDSSNEIMQQVSTLLSQHGISASITLHYNAVQSVYCIAISEGNWNQKMRKDR